MAIRWSRNAANRAPAQLAAPALRAGLLATLALGALAACEAATEPQAAHLANTITQTGSIGGTVFGQDGSPVAGAAVRGAEGVAAQTDPDGRFTITGLAPAARYPVTVWAPGYVPTTKVYEVAAGLTRERPIWLQAQTAPVTFSAGAGGSVAFGANGSVDIPANAFAGLAPGDPVTVRATSTDPLVLDQLDLARRLHRPHRRGNGGAAGVVRRAGRRRARRQRTAAGARAGRAGHAPLPAARGSRRPHPRPVELRPVDGAVGGGGRGGRVARRSHARSWTASCRGRTSTIRSRPSASSCRSCGRTARRGATSS